MLSKYVVGNALLGYGDYQYDYDLLKCFAFKLIEILYEYMMVYMMVMNTCMNNHSIQITYAFELCKLLH